MQVYDHTILGNVITASKCSAARSYCPQLLAALLGTSTASMLSQACFLLPDVVVRQGLSLMTVGSKISMLLHVKHVFKGMRAKLPDPPLWVDILPCNAFDFQRQFPQQYQYAFSGGELSPGVARLDVQMVSSVDLSYGCRGAKSATGPLLRSASGPLQMLDSGGGMERMASFLADKAAFTPISGSERSVCSTSAYRFLIGSGSPLSVANGSPFV